MSLLTVECGDDDASLVAIPETDRCGFNFKEIVRLGLREKSATPAFTETTIALQATWTTRLAASDGTQIALSPPLINGGFTANDAIYNDEAQNSDGFRRVIDETKPAFTAVTTNISPDTYVAFKTICALTNGQPGTSNLEVFFLLTGNRIAYKKATTNCFGVEFYAMFVSTPELANKTTNFNIKADLSEDWYNDIAIIDVAFDTKALVNPT